MLLTAIVSIIFFGATAYNIGEGVLPVSNGCTSCQVQAYGEWSQWSEWAECVTSFETRSQTRYRTCSTASCQGGTAAEARPCAVIEQPQAQWSEWGPWSGCSGSCGGGISTRHRICIDICSTCQCPGTSMETTMCNTQPCCEFGQWSLWSECSVSCGTNGMRYRTRQCSCPEGCNGPTTEQQVCNADQPCPSVIYEPSPPPSQPLCITCYLPQPPCPFCISFGFYGPAFGKRKREIDQPK